jgi:vancomycin resistance protein VanW
VFSVWRTAKRPSAARGYARAAALKDGVLTTDIGGAICLLSTVLYNVGLLGALEIVERHCHSVDSYGENRYFEPGRDAAIEFPYLDLRLRNPHAFPVWLGVRVDEQRVAAELRSPDAHAFAVTVAAEAEPVAPATVVEFDPYLPPGALVRRRQGLPGLRVSATRTVVDADGWERTERLPASYHRTSPEVWASGDRPSQRWQRAYDAPLGGHDAGDEHQRMGDPL